MCPTDESPRVGPNDWTDILASLCGRLYEDVLRAWDQTRDRRAPELWQAVGAFAIDARRRGVPVSDVLRALNAVIDPQVGGDATLDWDHLREHAGKVVIANYYRTDDGDGVLPLQAAAPVPGGALPVPVERAGARHDAAPRHTA